MTALYPQNVEQWSNKQVDVDQKTLDGIFRAMRSMRATYQMTRERPACYLRAADPLVRALVDKEISVIKVWRRSPACRGAWALVTLGQS